MVFEWDSAKALANEKKHGVSFTEASSAFRDPFSLTIADPQHSSAEDRFILIGYSNRDRLLVVVLTDRHDRLRIISARLASNSERYHYEESSKNT